MAANVDKLASVIFQVLPKIHQATETELLVRANVTFF